MQNGDVIKRVEDEDIELIRFEYCDVSGVARTKSVHRSQLKQKLVEGVGLTRAQMSMNLLEEIVPIVGMEPVGEIRLVPDPNTFSALPWAKGSASILCDQLDHRRENWGACTRSFLKSAIADAHSLGVEVVASFENEYYLAQRSDESFIPHDVATHAPVYSAIGHDFAADLALETIHALQSQGMIVEQAINEYGPGQQEIAIRYTDALRAADNQMKFRDTVRGVALRHDLYASFAPKPWPNEIGSGAHVHMSVWDPATHRSLLYDPQGTGTLSELGRHFIGGITEHLPSLVALTAPSYNSYRRLQPSAWASSTTAWGFDNREAAVRVASPFFQREEASFNLEYKPCDASANPYLALGAIIVCGLDGIRRSLEPAAPAQHDPATLSVEERERCGIINLPSTLAEALNNLRRNELLVDALGDLLARCYFAIKESEIQTFDANDEIFEVRHHFYRF
ncbi:MAG: glutamine synthetase family protein [Acidimicrobiales bacterium]